MQTTHAGPTVEVTPFQRLRFQELVRVLGQDPEILRRKHALERARTAVQAARAAVNALRHADDERREAALERLEAAEAAEIAAEAAYREVAPAGAAS